MTSMDQFRNTYFQECDERIAALELHLFEILDPDNRIEAVNAAFRDVHSIKGGAAMFGFNRLIAFAHILESVLDALRKGTVTVDAPLIERLVYASDVLADLAEDARSGGTLPPSHEYTAMQELTALAGSDAAVASEHGSAGALEKSTATVGRRKYRISFRPGSDFLRRGIDPLGVVRQLKRLGPLSVNVDQSALPRLEDLDPSTCCLAWRFELETEAPPAAIHDCFSVAADGAHLNIESVADDLKPTASLAPRAPTQSAVSPRPERRSTSIRIDIDRLEKLVDLVGEVTIAQAMVLQYIDKSAVDSNPPLFRALGQLQQLTRSLQDGVMAIRAQPVRSVFARLPRIARDVAQDTGKMVAIEMTGEDTEIDKTIIEQLADPLMHIVRNAVDHGIEPPGERRAAGKPETGRLCLSASQRGGRIVIDVSDDGRGIDREALVQRAIERQLITPDTEMTAEQIDNLVFMPGLSTAGTITDISGRGVGMDVVRKNIQSLGGRVSIHSQNGAGTTTSITLPLTLAVMDGMLVRSGPEAYLIPISDVVECVVASRSTMTLLPGSGEVLRIRGAHVPAIDLAKCLDHTALRRSDAFQVVVVETETSGRVAIIVDEIRGSQQIVVKSIRSPCGDVSGFAGATILGDGSIALILDISQLAERARGRESSTTGSFPANAIRNTKGFAA